MTTEEVAQTWIPVRTLVGLNLALPARGITGHVVFFKVLHLALRMLYLRQTLDLPRTGAVKSWPVKNRCSVDQAGARKIVVACEDFGNGIHRKDRLGWPNAFRMCLSDANLRGIEESYKITTSCVSATEAVAEEGSFTFWHASWSMMRYENDHHPFGVV